MLSLLMACFFLSCERPSPQSHVPCNLAICVDPDKGKVWPTVDASTRLFPLLHITDTKTLQQQVTLLAIDHVTRSHLPEILPS